MKLTTKELDELFELKKELNIVQKLIKKIKSGKFRYLEIGTSNAFDSDVAYIKKNRFAYFYEALYKVENNIKSEIVDLGIELEDNQDEKQKIQDS